MTPAEVLAALALPAGATVDQRVPKRLLLEHGAPTAADRRRITELVSELRWAAVLKPTTVGIAAHRDQQREYLEIAVLVASIQPTRSPNRLIELIHRAVPYPVLLLTERGGDAPLLCSLAPLRRSERIHEMLVLDGAPVVVELGHDARWWPELRDALALARQPRTSLLSVYEGWIDAFVAYQAAQESAAFTLAASAERVQQRRDGLATCARLALELARTRKAAAKTSQLAKRVDLNLEVHRLDAALREQRARL